MERLTSDEDPNIDESDEDEDDVWDRIRKKGVEVAYQVWDSGGPGAGMGQVTVYEYQGQYYADGDIGISDPCTTKAEAADFYGVFDVNSSTVRIWDIERGMIFERA